MAGRAAAYRHRRSLPLARPRRRRPQLRRQSGAGDDRGRRRRRLRALRRRQGAVRTARCRRASSLRTLPWRHAGSSASGTTDAGATHARRRRATSAFFPANYGFGPRGAATVVTVHDALNLLPLRHTLLERGHTTHAAHPRDDRLPAPDDDAGGPAGDPHRDDLRLRARHDRRRLPRAADDIERGLSRRAAAGCRSRPTTSRAAARSAGVSGRYVLADGLKNPGVILRGGGAAAGRPCAGRCTWCSSPGTRTCSRCSPTAVAAGDARLLVRPSSATLAALYSGAAAFVFPSWIEGFGIPLLEAMQYGAPIIASDRGSIPEVAGEAAIIVDAEDDAGLAAALAARAERRRRGPGACGRWGRARVGRVHVAALGRADAGGDSPGRRRTARRRA